MTILQILIFYMINQKMGSKFKVVFSPGSPTSLLGNVEAAFLSPSCDPISPSVKLGIEIKLSSVQGLLVFQGEKRCTRFKR